MFCGLCARLVRRGSGSVWMGKGQCDRGGINNRRRSRRYGVGNTANYLSTRSGASVRSGFDLVSL